MVAEHTSEVATGATANVAVVGFLALFAKIGIDSWGDVAAVLACLLTLTHLGILWWRVMWKPLLTRLGFMKRNRRANDGFR